MIESTTGERALYDLQEDPHETRDLGGETEIAKALASRLDEWILEGRNKRSAVELDRATLEHLRSLGYIR